MVIHQAKVQYSDGKEGRFFSRDGTWFYENQLPEKGAKLSPMKYERGWLKRAAEGSQQIASIEFTETEA